LIDGNTIIAAPSDFFDGFKQVDFPPRSLKELAPLIQASRSHEAALLPDSIGEVKGFEDGVRAKRQAYYAGALGAGATHAVRSYGKDPMTAYDGKASSIVAVYYRHAGLALCTVHPTVPNQHDGPAVHSGDVQHHADEIGDWGNLQEIEEYRERVAAFRNLREWASGEKESVAAVAQRLRVAVSEEMGGLSEDELAL